MLVECVCDHPSMLAWQQDPMSSPVQVEGMVDVCVCVCVLLSMHIICVLESRVPPACFNGAIIGTLESFM